MTDWSKQKLIVGRVTEFSSGKKVVAPFTATPHNETLLSYQKSLASLIAAAYLFQEEDTEENLNRLRLAARGLGKPN
jgi:hypothetical protein